MTRGQFTRQLHQKLAIIWSSMKRPTPRIPPPIRPCKRSIDNALLEHVRSGVITRLARALNVVGRVANGALYIVSMIPAQVFMLRVSTILLYCLYDTSSGVYVEGIHDLVVLSL